MATVDSIERAEVSAAAPPPPPPGPAPPTAGIWDTDDEPRGEKTKRKRVLVCAGLLVLCGAMLALALLFFFGLSGSLLERDDEGAGQIDAQSTSSSAGQQTDHNALGCFKDSQANRTLVLELVDPEEMTPDLCSTHCSGGSYAYYALQSGDECWCGGAGVDIDRLGPGVCDLACAGDSAFNCGGDLAYSAYEVGTEAAPPTPTPPGPLSSCASKATITYTSTVIYVEGGGCATLSDVYAAQPAGEEALFVTDASSKKLDVGTTPTGFWLVARHVHVIDGSTLYVHGKGSAGGDADILRIQSNSKDSYYEIRGHGGNLFFENTKVTSWDTFLEKEQEKHEGGRSFINCVSEKLGPEECTGVAQNDMGECRMDIVNSVMGNMGWFDSESYGLTWKVRGFCKDYSNPEVFDRTNVYGDILNSEIYGMYYGHYTYGHQGGVWTNNTMRDNVQYGFDPHDDSDYLTIADNTVYGNGNHGIIASKRCNNVKIYNNEVFNGGDDAVGIFLHRSSNKCEVYGNYVHDMKDSGMALMESMDADIHDNTFEDVKYGIRLSLGCARNRVYRNTFATCRDYGIYTYVGSDSPDESDDWDGRPRDNVFTNNVISDTTNGVKINSADDHVFAEALPRSTRPIPMTIDHQSTSSAEPSCSSSRMRRTPCGPTTRFPPRRASRATWTSRPTRTLPPRVDSISCADPPLALWPAAAGSAVVRQF